MSRPRCSSCVACSSQAKPCTSWSTAWRPTNSVRRWQHRLEPIQKRVFGGCHLTRPPVDLLKGAGFTISEVDVYYEKGAPKAVGANSLGVAQDLDAAE